MLAKGSIVKKYWNELVVGDKKVTSMVWKYIDS